MGASVSNLCPCTKHRAAELSEAAYHKAADQALELLTEQLEVCVGGWVWVYGCVCGWVCGW